ncbi:hypothetical protein CDAR_399251 [Caerostris darwini]|uniref:Uncharacterized protein n=1 Tax=Caerostris darwini TaxID=1538125 RepID=A0AAV4SWD9_9ARAC|nr:hypothetical protein CDAR_399251 [Caerostris darwini]
MTSGSVQEKTAIRISLPLSKIRPSAKHQQKLPSPTLESQMSQAGAQMAPSFNIRFEEGLCRKRDRYERFDRYDRDLCSLYYVVPWKKRRPKKSGKVGDETVRRASGRQPCWEKGADPRARRDAKKRT